MGVKRQQGDRIRGKAGLGQGQGPYIVPICGLGARACWVPKGLDSPRPGVPPNPKSTAGPA